MLPVAASLATPAGNGDIGVACKTLGPPATIKAAIAIANAVRIITCSLAVSFQRAHIELENVDGYQFLLASLKI
jgi:hypothetical protein